MVDETFVSYFMQWAVWCNFERCQLFIGIVQHSQEYATVMSVRYILSTRPQLVSLAWHKAENGSHSSPGSQNTHVSTLKLDNKTRIYYLLTTTTREVRENYCRFHQSHALYCHCLICLYFPNPSLSREEICKHQSACCCD